MNKELISFLERMKEHPELSSSKEAQDFLDYVIKIVSEGYPIKKVLAAIESTISE